MRRGPVRCRLDALAVIAAFLLGIGPGAPLQPCPKHQAVHGDESSPHTATLHGTHAETARADSHAGHAHADGAGATTNSHPHSGGPCDCLATCLTCCGPAIAGSALQATHPTFTSQAPRGVRPLVRPAPDPAAYLRPFGQPPPA